MTTPNNPLIEVEKARKELLKLRRFLGDLYTMDSLTFESLDNKKIKKHSLAADDILSTLDKLVAENESLRQELRDSGELEAITSHKESTAHD